MNKMKSPVIEVETAQILRSVRESIRCYCWGFGKARKRYPKPKEGRKKVRA